MSETPEESTIERALHDGLAAVPVQEPCAEFDSHIMAALRQGSSPGVTLRDALRQGWPRAGAFLKAMRQALPAAACSAIAMVALLHWTEAAPITTSSAHTSSSAHLPITDRMLEEADLTHMNLSLLWTPQNAPRPAAPPMQHGHADHAPRRQPIGPHAQGSVRPFA